MELTNTANFKGKTPKCVSDQTALSINHTTIYKGGWHYPPSAKVSIVADGETFKPVRVIQKELELEDGEYWESLVIEPKCEMYAKLSKAKAVEIRIGDASIALSTDEIADYRRFTEAIGFK